MELFGIIFALPVAILVGIIYPSLVIRLCEKSRVLSLAVGVVSTLIALSMSAEIMLIAKMGLLSAHDEFHPLLDTWHGCNTLLGPAALTNLTILWLRRNGKGVQLTWLVAGCACSLFIMAFVASSVLYDDAVHYRTDGEGTYRIDEK
jgi:hypothetical protein